MNRYVGVGTLGLLDYLLNYQFFRGPCGGTSMTTAPLAYVSICPSASGAAADAAHAYACNRIYLLESYSSLPTSPAVCRITQTVNLDICSELHVGVHWKS